MSMKPGATHKPLASIVCFASFEICGDIIATLPSRMPRSQRAGGEARPSNKRPFLISRSSILMRRFGLIPSPFAFEHPRDGKSDYQAAQPRADARFVGVAFHCGDYRVVEQVCADVQVDDLPFAVVFDDRRSPTPRPHASVAIRADV